MDRRIEDFPFQELVDDLRASEADVELCNIALHHGIATYSGGESVQGRLEKNDRIVEIIEAELARREEVPDASAT